MPACCTSPRPGIRTWVLRWHFPLARRSLTITGFETFGDNQFATPITLFPSLRNQDKYQFRYDLSHVMGSHAIKFGINFIHEPVLGGAFAATDETLVQYAQDPVAYAQDESQFSFSPQCTNFTVNGRLDLHIHSGWRRQLLAKRSASRTLRARLVARNASPDGQLWRALPDDLRPF